MALNIEGLQQLRRVMVASPDNDLFDLAYVDLDKDCGTAHCAAGWAFVDPWFMDQPGATEGIYQLWTFLGLTRAQGAILFATGNRCSDLHGPVAKQLVIENIDLLLQDKEPLPYPQDNEDEQ